MPTNPVNSFEYGYKVDGKIIRWYMPIYVNIHIRYVNATDDCKCKMTKYVVLHM